MGIIHRPIQRINVPDVFIISLNDSALFGKNMMIRKILLHFAEQKLFRLVIHFGDKVDHAFIAHLMFFIVASTQDRASLARKVLKIGQCWLHENHPLNIQRWARPSAE